MAARKTRQPGRPSTDDAPDTRDALLDAASRLFALHGAGDVSLRQLAGEAGVTPAMVHYYFGSKEGLHDAMLERTFDRVLERVAAVAARVRSEEGGPDERLGDLLEVLVQTFAAEPWVPTLVVREVFSEGGRFRDRFVQSYASRMAALLPDIIREQISAGRFRSDLEPELAFLSLMGMTIMPFVARPVIERVLDIRYDEAFLRRFVEHTQRLFVEGVTS
jgi:AcrR family transcriptional regulator